MRLRILSVDCPVSGKGIETFEFFGSSSFSDYDSIIIDTYNISEEWTRKISAKGDGALWTSGTSNGGYGAHLLEIMHMRSEETLLLLEQTGGIVICILRSRGVVLNYASGGHNREISRYSWIPSVWEKSGYKLSPHFKCKRRVGKEFGEINKVHPFSQYLSVLKDNLYFEAVIEDLDMLQYSTVIGKNKVGEIIALEIPVGIGKFIFIPPFDPSAGIDKITGVLKDCIRKSLQWSKPLARPDWLDGYTLPGQEDYFKELEKLDSGLKKIEEEREKVQIELDEIECLKGLLYETGKHGLEPSVRIAFRIIGFDVKEPEEYDKPYDLFAIEGDIVIIGEIEGSKNQVGVEKYRQLLDYVSEATLESKRCKGILIGNGFAGTEPSLRAEQFTEHAIRGCESQKYCRMPTTELYKAIEAILSNPNKRELRESVKKKVWACESEFRFDV